MASVGALLVLGVFSGADDFGNRPTTMTLATRLLLALAFQSAQFLPISTAPSLLVLGFAFVVALITGVIFGAAPAWFATRTDPADALRGSGRSTSDRSSFARKALLIVQATFSGGRRNHAGAKPQQA